VDVEHDESTALERFRGKQLMQISVELVVFRERFFEGLIGKPFRSDVEPPRIFGNPVDGFLSRPVEVHFESRPEPDQSCWSDTGPAAREGILFPQSTGVVDREVSQDTFPNVMPVVNRGCDEWAAANVFRPDVLSHSQASMLREIATP
jgi:hypothetical protein